MQKISPEQLEKRYQNLSKALQDTIFSERTADIIGKTCELREASKHTSKIARLTGRVLLGYLRPESFAQEIQSETGISEEKAGQIAHDIDAEIFSNVRLELKKLYPPTIKTPNVQVRGFAPNTQEIKTPQKIPTGAFAFAKKFSGTTEKESETKNQKLDNLESRIPAQSGTGKNPRNQQDRQESRKDVKQAKTQSYSAKFKSNKNIDPATNRTITDSTSQAPHKTPKLFRPPVILREEGNVLENIQTEINAVNVEERVEMIKGASVDANVVAQAKQRHTPIKKPQTQNPEGIKIKPVVPLPTFIQSKFKGISKTMFENKEKQKEAFQKFTTKSTDIKGVKKEQQSPYHEQIPQQEKQGKVIDLSEL